MFGLLLSSYGNSRKKDTRSLGEKVQQLMELSSKRSIIKLNPDHFRQFVRTSPRNYSMIVMFTALAPHYKQTMNFKYYQTQAYSNKLFFGIVDFDEGSDIFQMLKISSAPVLMHFPSKGIPKKSDTLDIQRVGYVADALARWVNERTDIQIRIFRPPNYSGTIALAMLFLLIGGLIYLRRNNLDFLYNKTMWAVLAMSYIHDGSQRQYIVETYIVFILNAAVVFGMILLCEAAASKGDVQKRKFVAIVGLAFVTFFFSLILSFFRFKAHGYPYSFLLK